MRIDEFPRPKRDNRRGICWSASPAHLSGPALDPWLAELQAMQIRWIKVRDDGRGSSLELCARLLAADLMPVVLFDRGPRPDPDHLGSQEIQAAQRLVAEGVRYFETNNEPDAPQAWPGARPPQWLDLVAERAIVDAQMILGVGGLPALPAMRNVDNAAALLQAIGERGWDSLFDAGAWIAVHAYTLNRPLDFPFDAVSQTDQPLSQEQYDAERTRAWPDRPLALINKWRAGQVASTTEAGGASPAAAASPQPAAGMSFLTWRRLDAQVAAALGHPVPLIVTEGGPVVGSQDDPRYARIDAAQHAALVAGIDRFLAGQSELGGAGCPPQLFAFCFSVLANARLGAAAAGMEGAAWYSGYWDAAHGLNGVLPATRVLKASAAAAPEPVAEPAAASAPGPEPASSPAVAAGVAPETPAVAAGTAAAQSTAAPAEGGSASGPDRAVQASLEPPAAAPVRRWWAAAGARVAAALARATGRAGGAAGAAPAEPQAGTAAAGEAGPVAGDTSGVAAGVAPVLPAASAPGATAIDASLAPETGAAAAPVGEPAPVAAEGAAPETGQAPTGGAPGVWRPEAGAAESALGGRVLDHTGAPAIGVLVQLWQDGTAVQEARTVGDGVFRFLGLGLGVYAVAVENVTVAGLALDGTARRGIKLSLGAPGATTGTIDGVVRGGEAGRQVRLLGEDGGEQGAAVLGPEGAFHFEGLAAGRYRLVLAPGGTMAGPIELAAGGLYKLVYSQRSAIRGQVSGPGPGTAAVLRGPGAAGETRQSVLDAGGAFAFEGLAPGPYSVQAGGQTFADLLLTGENTLLLPPVPWRSAEPAAGETLAGDQVPAGEAAPAAEQPGDPGAARISSVLAGLAAAFARMQGGPSEAPAAVPTPQAGGAAPAPALGEQAAPADTLSASTPEAAGTAAESAAPVVTPPAAAAEAMQSAPAAEGAASAVTPASAEAAPVPAAAISATAPLPAAAPAPAPPRFLIAHYVLFGPAAPPPPGQEKGPAGDELRSVVGLALDYLLRTGATGGFSLAEARQAARVTIVGDQVPPEAEAMLQAAGCQVTRLAGDSYSLAGTFARMLATVGEG